MKSAQIQILLVLHYTCLLVRNVPCYNQVVVFKQQTQSIGKIEVMNREVMSQDKTRTNFAHEFEVPNAISVHYGDIFVACIYFISVEGESTIVWVGKPGAA